ncbi:A24 family peptidase [Alkalibacterium putridalgicola]|uniref:prepilin peptidase n=1 Tax=Alkalibacterium putridalgicola TaxID=426703 RepID=UPI0034CF38F5
MNILILAFTLLYGLVFGSFFNVVGLRVPNGTLFKQERSYCDTCNRTLNWKELIPVFSFLRQKGKCATCHETISPLYPIMELATGILFAFTYFHYGWGHQTVLGLLVISLIIPVTVADLEYQRIPNKLLLFFAPLFITYRLIYPLSPWYFSIIGAVLAFGLLFLIILLSKGGMGMGDLKYFTLFGFIFGPYLFLLLFFLATIYGSIIGAITIKRSKGNRKTKIPFGPSIGLAALTVFYVGELILNWYSQFFI